MTTHGSDQLTSLWPFDTTLEQETYIQRVLRRYRETPTTAGHIRSADRQLARSLFQRGIPLSLVEAAVSLGAALAMPLNPVRSLHYFLPILKELTTEPPDPGYIDYINVKLRLHKRSYSSS